MKQITSFIVAIIVCVALWSFLAIQFTDFAAYAFGLPQARWQMFLFIWTDTPALLVGATVGMLIFRKEPLLFGITCALAAIASIVWCSSNPILTKFAYVIKWVLFFVFGISGSYFGWWILRVGRRKNIPLKVWQSLATFVVILALITLCQMLVMHYERRRLYALMDEAVQDEQRNEQNSEPSARGNGIPPPQP